MAIIIPLPGAARAPVVQPKRRGRFPKMVVRLWRLRSQSYMLRVEVGELEAKARSRREVVASMRDTINFALADAARLEAQALALRQRLR
ncbi:MAG: hypothetical protein NDI95_05660 [Acidovorax soli]|uniref:hypothetical protein n=1 Tax=Acidovorax soli TaxID=592050 RepID=UPI0026E9E9B5|nr:hypothetical protein [Acidovorax soli]MCM2346119.1 hypothetical protein [Acidovorax soli]